MPSSKIDWLSSNDTPSGRVFVPVVAAARGEIDAPAAQQIEARPLFGDADRMMQRQHGDRRRQPDALGARGDIGERQVGTGQHAERAEMMLADPRRVHPQLFGIQRLVDDVRDELVGRARVVVVVVVAQREVAEFHGDFLGGSSEWLAAVIARRVAGQAISTSERNVSRSQSFRRTRVTGSYIDMRLLHRYVIRNDVQPAGALLTSRGQRSELR